MRSELGVTATEASGTETKDRLCAYPAAFAATRAEVSYPLCNLPWS
jgi:hypothetical protein